MAVRRITTMSADRSQFVSAFEPKTTGRRRRGERGPRGGPAGFGRDDAPARKPPRGATVRRRAAVPLPPNGARSRPFRREPRFVRRPYSGAKGAFRTPAGEEREAGGGAAGRWGRGGPRTGEDSRGHDGEGEGLVHEVGVELVVGLVVAVHRRVVDDADDAARPLAEVLCGGGQPRRGTVRASAWASPAIMFPTRVASVDDVRSAAWLMTPSTGHGFLRRL